MHLVQGPKAVAGITWAQSSSELHKSNPQDLFDLGAWHVCQLHHRNLTLALWFGTGSEQIPPSEWCFSEMREIYLMLLFTRA